MAWVYVLKSERGGRYYIGSTIDLDRRVTQHRKGHTHTTARFGALMLAFSQEYPTIGEARSVERHLKKLKRRDYIERIIFDGRITRMP